MNRFSKSLIVSLLTLLLSAATVVLAQTAGQTGTPARVVEITQRSSSSRRTSSRSRKTNR